jgi:hypothetical protein
VPLPVPATTQAGAATARGTHGGGEEGVNVGLGME